MCLIACSILQVILCLTHIEWQTEQREEKHEATCCNVYPTYFMKICKMMLHIKIFFHNDSIFIYFPDAKKEKRKKKKKNPYSVLNGCWETLRALLKSNYNHFKSTSQRLSESFWLSCKRHEAKAHSFCGYYMQNWCSFMLVWLPVSHLSSPASSTVANYKQKANFVLVFKYSWSNSKGNYL